jgi:carbonic anhydrase
VPPQWRDTPIGAFLGYQVLGQPHVRHEAPSLLVGTCMDGRIGLHLPRNFAYILRTAGANLAAVEGNLAYVLGAADVKHVALMGHTGCRASRIETRRDQIVDGLVKDGWDRERAAKHVDDHVLQAGIDDPISFTIREAARIRSIYTRIAVVPMLYDTDTDGISLLWD